MKARIVYIFLIVTLLISGCTQPPVAQDQKNISKKKTTEEFSAYSSELYTLEKPANWEVEENQEFTYFKSPVDETNDLQENVVVYVSSAEEPGKDLIDFLQDSIEVLIETVPGFTIVEHREDKLGDVPAYRIIYTEDSKLKYLQVFAIKDKNTYILTYTAPAETFDKYLPEAEKIISSYRIR
ncbi:MAG TPA: PsbP-related protein [archaeon]|nr:PsbP-related protein [archaeon]